MRLQYRMSLCERRLVGACVHLLAPTLSPAVARPRYRTYLIMGPCLAWAPYWASHTGPMSHELLLSLYLYIFNAPPAALLALVTVMSDCMLGRAVGMPEPGISELGVECTLTVFVLACSPARIS